MKLIVDIPDDTYQFVKDLGYVGGVRSCKTIQSDVINAIKNGVPYSSEENLKQEIDSLVEIYDREDAKQAIKVTKPRRTWVYTSYGNGIGNYHCPECGTICPEMVNLREPFPFCPYCGEDLRGEEE